MSPICQALLAISAYLALIALIAWYSIDLITECIARIKKKKHPERKMRLHHEYTNRYRRPS